MSNFYALNVAQKSLYASQRAIELTGHNIANANTEGYTRQRIDFEAVAPGVGSALDNFSGGRSGGGVEIQGIVQIRNDYFDNIYRRENSILAELNTKTDSLRYIEDIFSEQSEAGIGSSLQNLFSSIEKLSADSGNDLLRTQLKQDAVSFTNTMHMTAQRLTDYADRQNVLVQSTVEEINSLADEISSLNRMIFNYELSGNMALDLRDSRNLMVDKLSSLVAVSVSEKETGEFKVTVGGMALVDHISVNHMVLKDEPSMALNGHGVLNVYWEQGDHRATITGGELKGLLDIRDSSDPENPGIAYFMSKIDTLAGSVVEKFNEINSGGYTQPYGSVESRTGINFFDPVKVTAADISISDELVENAGNIAASSGLVAGYDNWGNNENLQLFINMRDADDITFNGEIIGNHETFTRGIITEIAVAAGYNASKAEGQQTMVDYVENEKKSVSEVSLDEEMTNLIKYQHSYAAAAKLMTAIDEMISTLIHSLGTGGR